ncbi:MAG: DUF1972 domain-containing protein [Paludibacteraceae bacterium]
MKKIGIIGTNGLPGKYGGWDQLVIHLTENLRNRFNFIVYTSYTNCDKKNKTYNGTCLKRVPFKANGIQSIPYDIYSMIHAIFNCDLLFICGTSGCVFLPIIRLFRKKIILNPDGQEWKRDKWSKPIQWFLKISEKFGVKFATYIISDNIKIQEYIKAEYKKDSFLIEYGGDQVLKVKLSTQTKQKYGIETGRYAFKVCRIVPESNIDIILEAFSLYPSVDLILIGNWHFSEYGENLMNKYKSYSNLKLLSPIYHQETLDELRSNCGIYIHGHSVGGTNPSLVEAMNLGLCIVSFNVDYNYETTEGKALYFTDKNDLLKIICDFSDGVIDIKKYQTEMNAIAERRYKWSIITEKYVFVFNK